MLCVTASTDIFWSDPNGTLPSLGRSTAMNKKTKQKNTQPPLCPLPGLGSSMLPYSSTSCVLRRPPPPPLALSSLPVPPPATTTIYKTVQCLFIGTLGYSKHREERNTIHTRTVWYMSDTHTHTFTHSLTHTHTEYREISSSGGGSGLVLVALGPAGGRAVETRRRPDRRGAGFVCRRPPMSRPLHFLTNVCAM